MHLPILRNAAKALKLLSLISLTALVLNSCGGGGGDSGKNEKVIAPESLENVQMRLFGAFDLKFFRLSGTRGNENGAVDYTMIRTPFFVGNADGTNLIGLEVELPNILTNVSYTYVRTGLDTGKITINFINSQVYPYPDANSDNRKVRGGEMFWGGPGFLATELVVDILFTDNGSGLIGNTSARIRSAYDYLSIFTPKATESGSDVVTSDAFPFDFESANPILALAGGLVPVGYDPYTTITDTTPSSAVWSSIQGRSVNIFGSDLFRKIAHQSTGGSGVPIVGVQTPEESGTILIDSPSENVEGGSGTYSYFRTGGARAKFAIRYEKVVDSVKIPVEVTFDFDFKTLDGGDFTDSNGGIGSFREDNITNL